MTEDGDIDVLGIYARTLVSLSEGEVLQLTKSGDPGISEKDYLRVVFNKTASLIAAASETGAVLAGAGETLRGRMFEYGKSVGIAFQLMDDILDYTGTEKELGKPPRQDLREGKVTLPLLHALREADTRDRRAAALLLVRKERSERDITFLARLVERYGGIEYTARTARLYVNRGKKFLSALPDSKARAALLLLSDYIVLRSH
jgi:geranylgeranyl pyrophosphate synthase